jgi:trehalose 6-phosphate synthase/phosphatase
MFVGWPGIHVTDYVEQQEVRHLLLDMDCIPVFPSPNEFQGYIDFCTNFLWPAFNNVVRAFQGDNPLPFDQEQWAAYQVVNQRYADVVTSNVREPTDVIWVHDYHLFMVPMHITRKLRKANIGFFLHTPFPSSEIFRCLPIREELLKGLLAADLIGFQFWEYARHFLTCCRRILGLEFEFKRGGFIGIDHCSREVRVRVGHTCLQFEFTTSKILESPVILKTRELHAKYGNRFIFFGIDRLDRISGLRLKLLAYKTFLERNPLFRDKVVLVQYVYASMLQSVEDREKIASDLQSFSEEIKALFGHECMDLFIGDIDHTSKFAALRAADALIDTSLKDGLNLIPFEYCAARLSLNEKICDEFSCPITVYESNPPSGIASRSSSGRTTPDEQGVTRTTPAEAQLPTGIMILSEFTGCSRVLVGAIKVNPWNTERVVDSMMHAFQMSPNERRRHFGPDANYVATHSLIKWAQDFISDVRESRKKDDVVYVSFGFGANTRLLGIDQNFGKLNIQEVVSAYKKSKKLRFFLLDNEGTLAIDLRNLSREHGASTGTLWSEYPNELSQDQGSPPSRKILKFLRLICSDPKNIVVITSGRQRPMLENWFSGIVGIGFAAEHGFTYKVPALNGETWKSILPPGCESTVDMTWASIAYQLMELYRKRVQNTYIQFKGSAMVWVYREADPELGVWQARELSAALEETLSSHHVVVSSGKGYVEVRIRGVNKGVVATTILDEIEKVIARPDFVLCIGDDRSDELMFESVNDAMKPELSAGAGEELGPPTPELCRARSGKSFSDLTMCTPGMDVRNLSMPSSGSMKRSPSSAGAAFGEATLGSLDSRHSSGSCKPRSHAPTVFTCTVGKKPSKAKYYLNDVDEVSELLHQLVSDGESDAGNRT